MGQNNYYYYVFFHFIPVTNVDSNKFQIENVKLFSEKCDRKLKVTNLSYISMLYDTNYNFLVLEK